jgi:hypothetical protein
VQQLARAFGDAKELESGATSDFRAQPMRFVLGRRVPAEVPEWVIFGDTGPSAARQVNLNKRTLTPRAERLSFDRSQKFSHQS